jgi:hypothetical protein
MRLKYKFLFNQEKNKLKFFLYFAAYLLFAIITIDLVVWLLSWIFLKN